MGKRLLRGVTVNSMSHGFRRFRALVQTLAEDLGGMASLPEAERALIKQAAALTVRLEQTQAAIVNGESVPADEVIRLTSALCRIDDRLRKRAAERNPPPMPARARCGRRTRGIMGGMATRCWCGRRLPG